MMALLNGRYQILQLRSALGRCQSYLTQDTHHLKERLAVVKQLKLTGTENLSALKQRFSQQIALLEQLGHHPQIPYLYDSWQGSQDCCWVQEWVEGCLLKDELPPQKSWTEDRVIQMLQEVLEPLAFIHRCGVIHGALRPENLLRRQTDQTLVILGLGSFPRLSQQILEDYPAFLGHPGYAPPEQVRGEAQPSSDLYALGMIAIQALTGVSPLELHEEAETGERIWQHLRPLQPQLVQILRKMTCATVQARYQSAKEVLGDLKRLDGAGLEKVSDLRSPLSGKKLSPVALAMGAGLLTLGFGVVMHDRLAGLFSQPQATESSPATPPRPQCKVAIGRLNVRRQPKGEVVAQVSQGTPLTLTGQEKTGWAEINQPVQGWVFKDSQYINCDS